MGSDRKGERASLVLPEGLFRARKLPLIYGQRKINREDIRVVRGRRRTYPKSNIVSAIRKKKVGEKRRKALLGGTFRSSVRPSLLKKKGGKPLERIRLQSSRERDFRSLPEHCLREDKRSRRWGGNFRLDAGRWNSTSALYRDWCMNRRWLGQKGLQAKGGGTGDYRAPSH